MTDTSVIHIERSIEARNDTGRRLFGYKGGTFTKNELAQARKSNKPLTMDCALPGDCMNNCVYCGFAHMNTGNKLSEQEILCIFEEFATLGGKSIKILGEGEPMLSKNMLYLLKVIHDLGMIPVLFTCGDVLGSEELAQKIHGRTCKEIVQELYENNVTIMLKYEKKNQDDLVQRNGYTLLRDRALRALKSQGFNKNHPTRLGFAIVLTKYNYIEVPGIFCYALENNIYPLVCPLMPIGKMKVALNRNKFSPNPRDITCLSRQLINLRKRSGIELNCDSDFPGGLPCDISRSGMYMDDVGNLKVCESDEVVGNIRNLTLAELWLKCSELKNTKYGDLRWKGLCFPKRKEGIVNGAGVCLCNTAI